MVRSIRIINSEAVELAHARADAEHRSAANAVEITLIEVLRDRYGKPVQDTERRRPWQDKIVEKSIPGNAGGGG